MQPSDPPDPRKQQLNKPLPPPPPLSPRSAAAAEKQPDPAPVAPVPVTPPVLRKRANTEDYLMMAGASKPKREGHTFEQFLVVGIPHNADLSRVPARYEPQILFQWPPDLRVKTMQIEHFCFPNGVETGFVRRTPSCSSLNEVLHAPSHSHNSFIFLLTGENTFLYGVCVTRPEFLADHPSFFPLPHKPLPHGPQYVVAHRCYCLLSRFPFFRLHFDVLHQLLSAERILRMEMPFFEQPTTHSHPPGDTEPKAAHSAHQSAAPSAPSHSAIAVATPDVGPTVASAAAPKSGSAIHPHPYPLPATPKQRKGSEPTISSTLSATNLTPAISTAPSPISSPAPSPTPSTSDLPPPPTNPTPEGATPTSTPPDFASASPLGPPVAAASAPAIAVTPASAPAIETAAQPSVNPPEVTTQTLVADAAPSTPSVDIRTSPRSPANLASNPPTDAALSTPPTLVPASTSSTSPASPPSPNAPTPVGGTAAPATAAAVPQAAEQHPVVSLLKCYHQAPIPKQGESIVLQLNDSIRLSGLQNIAPFYCPPGDENAKLVGDWCLAGLFRTLSLENFLILFGGLLQEKQIIFVSKNLTSLSHAALSVIPIMRPFVWQGLFIPILPHALADYLEAPVPFVVGIQRQPIGLRPDLLVVLLDSNKILTMGGDKIPEAGKLLMNLRNDHRLLYRPNTPYNPYHTTQEQLAAVHSALTTLGNYLQWLLQRVMEHYGRFDLAVSNKEDIRMAFVTSCSPPNRGFISAFLNTQHFSQYLDMYHKRPIPAGLNEPAHAPAPALTPSTQPPK